MVECHQSFSFADLKTRIVQSNNTSIVLNVNKKEACASPRVRLSIFDVVNQLDAEQILVVVVVLDDVVDAFDISLVG